MKKQKLNVQDIDKKKKAEENKKLKKFIDKVFIEDDSLLKRLAQ